MRRSFFIVLLICIFLDARAQGSVVHENLSLKSHTLQRVMFYSVYLPAGYSYSHKTYPILYLLHGMGDNHTSIPQKGQIQQIVDKTISAGNFDPHVIVMPDAGMSYYMNSKDGKMPYEDYFFS